ncbi:MAG: hypothetical protein KDK59_09205 [Simkania sp.]|nr:hypothetical protein [Simkania sp.]
MAISADFVLPQVSLHRLKLPKPQREALCSPSDPERAIAIATIVQSIALKCKLQSIKSDVEKINGFHVFFYCNQSSGVSLMGKQLETQNPHVSFERSQTDYLVFFVQAHPHQKPDLYAATRGSGMPQMIKNLTDYKFPWKVAKRHLSPLLLELETRHLVGTILKSSVTFYGAPSFSLLQLQSRFVTHFTAKLRERSSVHCQLADHEKKQPMVVDVKMKSIRMHAELTLSDYSNILIQFSKIYRKEKTFMCTHTSSQDQTPEEDHESFSFLDLVVRAPLKEKKELEDRLLARLWELYSQIKTVSDIRFWHRYSDDYLRSGTFTLSHQNKPIEKWTAPPSLSDVLSAMKNVKKIDTLEHFVEEIKTFKMGFQRSGLPYQEGLMNFFEAEIIDPKGTVYFRNHGTWLKASSEYLTLVQNDFHTVINTCFIPRSHPAHLHHRWMSQMSWAKVTWKEIKTLAGSNFKELWSQLEPITIPITSDGKISKKKRRGEEIKERGEKKQRLKDQTITSLLSGSQTPPLPEDKATFVISETPKDFPNHLQPFLEEKHHLYKEVKNEGEYNALYIEEPTFLVGDRITPNGIELFDLLKEAEEELYLYQVKESISEKATKACSQLRNAASALAGALLNPGGSSNILEKFWSEAISDKKDPYFKKLTTSYRKYGKEKFFELFQRDRKNICFVLAFLDDHQKEVIVEKEGKKEITVSPKDFENMSSTSGKTIYQELLKQGYIDEKGTITTSFIGTKKGQFTLGESIDPTLTTRIFYKLCRKTTPFQSTLAKVDIALTKRMIEELGFTFRMCQVFRPDNTADIEEESNEWDLPKIPFKLDLPTGPFVINGKNHSIFKTPTDGSSGLHALLGEITGNECRILDKNPKELLAEKIQENLKNEKLLQCQMDLLENALSSNPSKEAKQAYPPEIFEEFQSRYQPIKKALAEKRAQLQKKEGEKWTALINSHPEAKRLVMKSLFPKKSPHFQKISEQSEEVEKLIKWIDQEKDQIEKFFIAKELLEVEKLHQERMNLDQEETAYKKESLSEASVKDAYIKAIQHPDYSLSTHEVLLAAKLFEISCRIYIKHNESYEVAGEYCHPQKEVIPIFYHFPFSKYYSRLAPDRLALNSE